MNISTVIIAKNSERTIRKTLESLSIFDDVVVYDNGSTDATIKISKEFNNVNLIQGDFLGFGETKNKASSYAKNDWILILDSDEVLDEKLINTLKTKNLDKNCVYMIKFNAYYKNKQIKYCGWSGQKIKRLFNKTVTKFNNNKVHENIIDKDLKIEVLDGFVKHYSYSSISDFIIKVDRYSTIFAEEKVGVKKSSPLKAILNGFFSFFKTYFIKKGFLDGYAGLIIAFSHMATNFYKYIKLYELNKERQND